MSAIVEFLRARLDEEEDRATLAHPGPWDQARTLADITAKRALVEMAAGSIGGPFPAIPLHPQSGVQVGWPHTIVTQLAAVWVDHPAYDPAWRPS